MASITLAIDEQLKLDMKGLPWVNWSELAREDLLEDTKREQKLQQIRKQLESKEEQEFIKWSVEMGQKVNEGMFKRLLVEMSPKERKALLSKKHS